MPPAAYPDPDRLRAANINPATGLATDYLNHYNEVAMLIATLADIPEMRDSVLEWRPVGYPTHFARTGFADRGLAIAAYITAPRDAKVQFLAAREEIEARIGGVQGRLAALREVPPGLASEASEIFADIARLGGIINGGKTVPLVKRSAEQELVDSFFP
jgi:hypothetical protein